MAAELTKSSVAHASKSPQRERAAGVRGEDACHGIAHAFNTISRKQRVFHELAGKFFAEIREAIQPEAAACMA